MSDVLKWLQNMANEEWEYEDGDYALEAIKFFNSLRADLATITAERDRLREALEFYGWAEHWVKQPYKRSVIEDDKGRRARSALEGSPK